MSADDNAIEVKQRWAGMEDAETESTDPDAVYDDISGQRLDVDHKARVHELEGVANMEVLEHCGQGRMLPEGWNASHRRVMG